MNQPAKHLSDKTLEMVAERFRLLGDPLRLRLLHLLAEGEQSVSGLVAATGAAQGNLSKHLQLLLRAGLVRRRKEGLWVHYSLADGRVFELCDVVCGSLGDHLERELESFRGEDGPRAEGSGGAAPRAAGAPSEPADALPEPADPAPPAGSARSGFTPPAEGRPGRRGRDRRGSGGRRP